MTGDELVIKNVNIINGKGDPAFSVSAVIISGSEIKKIVFHSEYTPQEPECASVIDGSGFWLMPGLIDGHCHLSFGYPGHDDAENHQGTLSAEYGTLRAAHNARKILMAGVTGVSVPGGSWFTDVAVREGIRNGIIVGPHVFAGGRFLSTYGSISDPEPSWVGSPAHSLGVLANSLPEMVTEVRRQCKHGVDLIKIADSTWGDNLTLSLEELTAVVEEAHRRNTKVTIHARGAGATRIAAQAGVDWIMHADMASDEDLAIVAEKQIPVMPTLTALERFITAADEFQIPQKLLSQIKYNFDHAVRNLEKMRQFGIPVICGTDTGNSPAMEYGSLHAREPALLVRYGGYSAPEAIRACTSLNALTLGMAGRTGIIEEGALADLILLKRDPSTYISVLSEADSLALVMKEGVIYKNDMNLICSGTR